MKTMRCLALWNRKPLNLTALNKQTHNNTPKMKFYLLIFHSEKSYQEVFLITKCLLQTDFHITDLTIILNKFKTIDPQLQFPKSNNKNHLKLSSFLQKLLQNKNKWMLIINDQQVIQHTISTSSNRVLFTAIFGHQLTIIKETHQEK